MLSDGSKLIDGDADGSKLRDGMKLTEGAAEGAALNVGTDETDGAELGIALGIALGITLRLGDADGLGPNPSIPETRKLQTPGSTSANPSIVNPVTLT